MTPVLVVISIVTVWLCLWVRFGYGIRGWLLNGIPWLQQSWTAIPYFVYWQAHIWFAYGVTVTAQLLWPGHVTIVAVLGLNVAALKEFVYDYVWELPVQTDSDDWQDVAGYVIGIVIGALIVICI